MHVSPDLMQSPTEASRAFLPFPGTLYSRRRQKSGTENPDHKACQRLGKSDPLSLPLSHPDLTIF